MLLNRSFDDESDEGSACVSDDEESLSNSANDDLPEILYVPVVHADHQVERFELGSCERQRVVTLGKVLDNEIAVLVGHDR